jgi:hypothetical protein
MINIVLHGVYSHGCQQRGLPRWMCWTRALGLFSAFGRATTSE